MNFLFFATDILPIPGLPTSGTALRTHGLVSGLRAHGHSVTTAVPKAALDGVRSRQNIGALPKESQALLEAAAALSFDGTNQSQVVDQVQPDVIVCGHWPAMILQQKPPVPLIIDLAGPHLLERHYQGAPHQDAAILGKIAILATADGYIVSGPSQASYFDSFLARAGVENAHARSCTITMPLSPEQPPVHTKLTSHAPHFIFGGVFLPWQDPAAALSALADELHRRNQGTLTLVGGKHPNYAVNVGKYASLFDDLEKNPRIKRHPMLPLEGFIEKLQEADVALDLMAWNLERELAMTIRSTTYLWAGLPTIYNSFADLSALIRRYDAGWCVDPDVPAELGEVFETIFSRPEVLLEKSANASRLAREIFSWDRAVVPLLDLLSSISRQPKRLIDVIVDLPEHADLEVLDSTPVRQSFVSRSDGLQRVEVRIATHARSIRSAVELELAELGDYRGADFRLTSRQVVTTRSIPAPELYNNEWLRLDFSPQSSSGKIYELTMRSAEVAPAHAISPWAVRANPFPLLTLRRGADQIPFGLCLRTSCIQGSEKI